MITKLCRLLGRLHLTHQPKPPHRIGPPTWAEQFDAVVRGL